MSTSNFKISSMLFIGSTVAAMGVHWYLAGQHISVKYAAEAASSMCNISETINCSTTIMSAYSEVFGIPLAIFGFVTNLVILFFGLKSMYLDQDPKKSTVVALGLSLFSVIASLVMGLISILMIRSLCPFCVTAYVLSFVTFFSVLQWTSGFRFQVLMTFIKPLAISFVVIGALGFVAGKVVMSSVIPADMKEQMALVASDWKSRSAQEVTTVEPLTYGPDTAKMKILEFSDFLCPHCKNALPKLHNFADVHKNDVQIIFQNFPLDGCAGPEDNPGRRCDLAKMAYCAQKQNKGWEAQEYLFSNQEGLYQLTKLDEELPKISTHVNINADEFKTCFKNPETLKTIKAQIEVGKKLGIEGTPALFINNKQFRGAPSVLLFQQIFDTI